MKSISAVLCFCSITMGLPLSGLTQETDETVEVGEVAITATKVETPIKQIGSSVTIITAEELAREQNRFVLDALRQVPGVEIRRSGSPGSQTSIFTRGTDSDHTLLMIDGIQVHDVSSPTGAAVMDHLMVDNVGQIEVVRGPQSTLSGSDSIGGVINIVTKKGSGRPTFSFSAEGGSFGTATEWLHSSGGSHLFNYSMSLSHMASKGFSSRPTNDEDDPYRNMSFNGRFGVDPSEGFGVDLFGRYINADIEIDTGGNPDLSETDSKQAMFKAQPHLELLGGLWEQKLGIWMHDISRDNRGTGFVLPSAFQGTVLGVDWQHNLYVHNSHTITLGTEFEHQNAEFNVTGFPDIDADTDNLAFYLQDMVGLWDRLSGAVGLRVDDHEIAGTKVTYRVAGVFDLKETRTLFRSSVGSGFKAPSLSELFDSSFGSNNPNLKPEKSIGFDVALEQTLIDGMLKVGATYFYNDIDDMIVAAPPSFQNINVENVVTNGVETFVTIIPIENLMTRLHYTYTDTEARKAASFGISEGSRLLRRPLHNFSGDISYRFLKDRAQVTVTIIYVGERADLDPTTFATVTADDYVVVNLPASLRLQDNLDIFARIENLFDRDYQEVLGFNAPGISAYGGVKISF